MKIAFFNSKPYETTFFDLVNQSHHHEIHYFTPRLNFESSALVSDESVVCAFVNDSLNEKVLITLKQKNVKLIALRCAGFNNVDLACAEKIGLPILRVPAYSPYAVAEHAVGLLQCLNRHIHRAHNRVREGDFSLNNLMGFDLHGKTVGVIGTGTIGRVFIRIMQGFGCRVIANDLIEDPECIASGVIYTSREALFSQSDIISLHCPLNPQTEHIIDHKALDAMKQGVTIINTSRGKLIDTAAVIKALKIGKIGLLGLDVYEEEEAVFFEDLSESIIQDDQLSRLLTFPNVLVTSHQAFFTQEAMLQIAQVSLSNITAFEKDGTLSNAVHL